MFVFNEFLFFLVFWLYLINQYLLKKFWRVRKCVIKKEKKSKVLNRSVSKVEATIKTHVPEVNRDGKRGINISACRFDENKFKRYPNTFTGLFRHV